MDDQAGFRPDWNRNDCSTSSAFRGQFNSCLGIEPASVAPTKSSPIYTHSGAKRAAHAANGEPIRRIICSEYLAHAEIAGHNLRMNSSDYKYIWQAHDWPNWRFDLAALAGPMAEVSRAQGLLMGRLADVGMALRNQASLAALTEDVVKTSEIEGEQLNAESVRSSIARRLGVDIGALAPVDRNVEGVVEMVLDATANCHAPVSRERLFGWHAALFPTGYSGLSRIKVGGWRDDASGPMLSPL